MTESRPTFRRLSDVDPTPRRSDWGPWQLDRTTRVLYTDRYEVDLDDCRTSAQVLDWICQVAGKEWGGDVTLAGLVRALNDVLTPQATLCSFGQSRQLTRSQIAEHVRQAPTQP